MGDVPFPEVSDEQLVAAAFRVEALVHRRGWDQYPSVWMLTQVRAAGSLFGTKIPSTGLNHTYDFAGDLHRLATGLLEARRDDVFTGYGRIGYLVAHESWLVSYRDVGTPAGGAYADQVNAAADNRELHKHPDRVETRVVSGVTGDRRHFDVIRERGGEPTAKWWEEKTGRVIEAMAVLGECAAQDWEPARK